MISSIELSSIDMDGDAFAICLNMELPDIHIGRFTARAFSITLEIQRASPGGV
jgi:hypothetical protein